MTIEAVMMFCDEMNELIKQLPQSTLFAVALVLSGVMLYVYFTVEGLIKFLIKKWRQLFKATMEVEKDDR